MKVEQIYEVVNDVTSEAVGEQAVLKEDLSNVVDYGSKVFDNMSMDNFCKKLIDRIGKTYFDTKVYTGFMRPLYRESFEYGAAKQMIYCTKLNEAQENESWKLVPGNSYDPNIFTGSPVEALFFDSKTTLEVPLSLADIQVRSAFNNAGQLNEFLSMLERNVGNSLTVKQEQLAQRCINYLVGQTLFNEFPSVTGDNYSSSTGVKAVNLLKLYNTQHHLTGADALTFADAMVNPDFMRYSSYVIKNYMDYVRGMSVLFNIGTVPTFTESSELHILMNSTFKNGVETFLQSNTFHDQLVAMPQSGSIPYWQGTGTTYDLSSTTKIHLDILDPSDNQTKKEIEASGILAVMFDHMAAGVMNENRRTTSNYNGRAEFQNYWYKVDATYWNNFNANAICFFAA